MEARMIPLGMIGSWVIQHQVPQYSARPVGMQCPFSEVELKDSLNPNNICSDAIRSRMNWSKWMCLIPSKDIMSTTKEDNNIIVIVGKWIIHLFTE